MLTMYSSCVIITKGQKLPNSQDKMLVPHGIEGLRFDFSHLDAPGRQRLLGAGAFLQLVFPLPEAELPLFLLLGLPRALTLQDPQHAVGVAVALDTQQIQIQTRNGLISDSA